MNMFRTIYRFIYNILTNKFQVLIIIFIIAVVLCFSHFGELLNNTIIDENNNLKNCGEKIDIVYTWVNGSDVIFRENMKKYLNKDVHKVTDYSEERYDDKYELKFSLRSLEIFAPWVNHVYIVTNGQIPYWLNLDYEKVSIITHEEIFVDLDNLPTFSSPSIESNIHRIPGLSKRFIYFNDDIFLGAPVYPDDFFSPNKGFLVYLAWPLPSCVPNCPWVYVGDGQCDSSCYNIDCQFDGGDCDNSESRLHSHHMNSHHDFDEGEDINYDYFDEDVKTNNFVNENFIKIETNSNNSNNSNKILLGSVQIVNKNNTNFVSMTTGLKTNKITTKLNDKTSVLDFVKNHNQKFILNDKLKRKKRLFKTLRKRKDYYKHVFNVTNNNNGSESLNSSNIELNTKNRQNLDTYALSLQHTNRVLNLNYGYKMRKVPAHAPILIDKDIMNDLQLKFEREIRITQKNKFRSYNDIQYSFSYYYFLINEKIKINISDIFEQFDTDFSGTWSDREIRTILTKINDLPLNYGMVEIFDNAIINCSKHVKVAEVTVPTFERYIDSKLPTVSKELVFNCPAVIKMLDIHFGIEQKYNFEILKNAQGQFVLFKMLTSNVSDVVGHLDEIRKQPRKFVCLNDNMNPRKTEDNDLVKAILLDFYISLFPNPSKFELPQEYRNRFSYIEDLENWKKYHTKLKIFLMFCIVILFSLCFHNICKRRLIRQIKNIIYF